MIRIATIIMMILLLSCNKEELTINERNILIDLYVQEFGKLEESIDYFIKLGTQTNDIVNLISNTKRELIDKRSLKESKRNIVKYLEINMSKKTNGIEALVDTLNANLDRFSNSNMTFIEELNFVNKTFEFGYWSVWSCTSFNIHENNYYKIDTFEFKANSEFSLEFYNPRLKSFKLLSNSLQKEKPNELYFKTNSNSEILKKVNYSYTCESLVTGEKRIFKDSIIIRTKKDDR